ncbi:hypothetical protein D8B26_007067 [Coccidioides posadasii str. Silveira]|uniref:uncharacterized protein n=1 Tax=Coccidioides posadasii (strain RMSCC 757 / Silveira) TaxID=443226 RepID=UPI001BF0411F|nr:hypothetical protein D8B26_007067 [Coccidioides posadasii str. Silveira]
MALGAIMVPLACSRDIIDGPHPERLFKLSEKAVELNGCLAVHVVVVRHHPPSPRPPRNTVPSGPWTMIPAWTGFYDGTESP